MKKTVFKRPYGVERSVMLSLLKNLRPNEKIADDLALANKPNPDPRFYTSADQFKIDYLLTNFLRKWKGLKTGIDLKSVALNTFYGMERHCFKSNSIIKHLSTRPEGFGDLTTFIVKAQKEIEKVLGPVRMDRMAKLCRFGNGATSDLSRGSTHFRKTLSPSITLECIPLFCVFADGDPYLLGNVGGFKDLNIVDASRVVTVPKTSKTDRTIAAEPTLNSFVQQGIGRYIRERLLKFGVNLNDQTINQKLAFSALVDGLSTIDLSSASDTLSFNLVELLLPPQWFELLCRARCGYSTIDGKRLRLEKFSSMGNAFTFELESLIFYALCKAVCGDETVSVYGDDIIIPNDHYPAVVNLLTTLGFIINGDKSFTNGSRFYESCGSHYFDLEDVTPCYQKDVCTRPVDLIRLHNRLVRAGLRLHLSREVDEALRIVRDVFRRATGFETLGPVVEYDEFFIDPNFKWSQNQDKVKLRSLVTIARTRDCNEEEQSYYYGRKLRQHTWINSDAKGKCVDDVGFNTRVIHKYHWRSSSS